MTYHYMGLLVNGQRTRLQGYLTDTEFDILVWKIWEGNIPKGIWFTHVEEGENIDNSLRVQTLEQIPRLFRCEIGSTPCYWSVKDWCMEYVKDHVQFYNIMLEK